MRSLILLFATLTVLLLTVAVLESCGSDAKRISCDVTTDRGYLCTCSAMRGDKSFASVVCTNAMDTSDLIKFNVNLGE